MTRNELYEIIFTRMRRHFKCPRGGCACSYNRGCSVLRDMAWDIAKEAIPEDVGLPKLSYGRPIIKTYDSE